MARKKAGDDATSLHPSSLQAMLDYVAHMREERRRPRQARPVRFMGKIDMLPAGVPAHIGEGIVWAQFLEANLDRFQRTVDVPIGNRLGCGRFGCVFSSESPWVVKLTRDKDEGPVWATMQGLLEEPDEEVGRLGLLLPSYLRVHDVVRITPDVIFIDRQQPVFAIVREEAAPIFDNVAVPNPRDKYDTQYKAALSEETLRRLGLTDRVLAAADLQRPVLYDVMAAAVTRLPRKVQEKFAELHIAVQATRSYRVAADTFHMYRWKSDKTAREEEIAESALQDMMAACDLLQRLPVSRELGVTLATSQVEADLVFRDLHMYNIGWRIHAKIASEKLPKCMVILDPGAMATPFMPEIREVELLKNVGMYLRNAGLLDLEPNDAEAQFTDVSARKFFAAFESAMGPNNPYSAYVSHYSIPELEDMLARYLSATGLSGITVKDHGDGRIEGTALFNEGDPRGSGALALAHAINHSGVNYLECFGEGLRDLYESMGFVVDTQSAFNDEYAPQGWNYSMYGRPDYFTLKLENHMRKNPTNKAERESAVAEMVANPDAFRASIIESLRMKGLTDAEIRREIAIIDGTVGF